MNELLGNFGLPSREFNMVAYIDTGVLTWVSIVLLVLAIMIVSRLSRINKTLEAISKKLGQDRP
jgi:ABC-type spermidine/putrescine transport system permease subunit I